MEPCLVIWWRSSRSHCPSNNNNLDNNNYGNRKLRDPFPIFFFYYLATHQKYDLAMSQLYKLRRSDGYTTLQHSNFTVITRVRVGWLVSFFYCLIFLSLFCSRIFNSYLCWLSRVLSTNFNYVMIWLKCFEHCKHNDLLLFC